MKHNPLKLLNRLADTIRLRNYSFNRLCSCTAKI